VFLHLLLLADWTFLLVFVVIVHTLFANHVSAFAEQHFLLVDFAAAAGPALLGLLVPLAFPALFVELILAHAIPVSVSSAIFLPIPFPIPFPIPVSTVSISGLFGLL